MIISSEEKATSVLSSRIQAFNLEGKDISSKRRSYILFCGNIAGFDLVGFFFSHVSVIPGWPKILSRTD